MDGIDWKSLGFSYLKTDYNIRCHFRNGQWGEFEVSSSEQVDLHIAATALHYGQSAFEGLKAFRGQDGRVRVFRCEENARRMALSSQGIMMAEFPIERFKEAVRRVLTLNARFIPPYESGASLYIRPLLFGTGANIGVKAATEYLFLVLVTPVGPYFKEGFKPVELVIFRQYDRAAPLGTGNIKIAGNYAASLAAGHRAHQEGYAAVLYLDPKEKKFVDEGGPANFFGIKDNSYITPRSDTILPSITNKSLMVLAEEMGLKVEKRPIPAEELGTFEEVGICGTAAVISPVKRIYDHDLQKEYRFCPDGNPGPFSVRLYNRLRAIQYGDEADPFGWVEVLEGI
jgi:branched-chain amino acid aminotransferase